jgi:hypothetical protein
MHLPESADELDLLARIYVKQGRYSQARRRWKDALKVGGEHTKFKQCIEALDQWLEYRQELLFWRIKLGLYLVAILLSFWLLFRLGLIGPM